MKKIAFNRSNVVIPKEKVIHPLAVSSNVTKQEDSQPSKLIFSNK
jgi:hypothetical protein